MSWADKKPSGLGALLGAWAIPAIIALAGFVFAYQFVDPAPPAEFTLATGQPEGAYHRFGLQYQKLMAHHGIEVHLRSTAGTQENLALLSDPESGVDMAFVQSGVGEPSTFPHLVSLASLYPEPLWIFGLQAATPLQFSALEGQVLVGGSQGSGTRVLLGELLADNGLSTDDVTLSTLDATAGLDALLAGEVDWVFYVGGADAPVVKKAVSTPELAIVGLARAGALARRHAYLKLAPIPRGLLSLTRDQPDRNLDLVAPTANLASRDSFHPALIDLVLQTADKIHSDPTLLAEADQFPAATNLAFPLSSEAQRYFRSGPSLLQRFLPFWAATLIDRLVVMLVPLVALLLPLIKTMPPLYRWRIRRRIYRWYESLEAIDRHLQPGVVCDDAQQLRERLNEIESEVKQVVTPLSYADKLYDLRQHLDLVRGKVDACDPARELTP